MGTRRAARKAHGVGGFACIAALLVAGCFGEADDTREVDFLIRLEPTEKYPRDANPQILTLGPADAEALGMESPTVRHDFGTFAIHTKIEASGDPAFAHCLIEPIVISDADTGETVQTIDTGTCLEERSPIDLPAAASGDAGP